MKETIRSEGIKELRDRRCQIDEFLGQIDPEGLIDQQGSHEVKRRQQAMKKIMRKVVSKIIDELDTPKDMTLHQINDLYKSMMYTCKFYHKRFLNDACRAYERSAQRLLSNLEISYEENAATLMGRCTESETFYDRPEHFADLHFLQEHIVVPGEVDDDE